MSDKTLTPEADFAETKVFVAERRPPASTLFLLALSAVALYFCYLIAKPFLDPIFLAVMIAIVFHPVHVSFQHRIRRRNLAALTSTLLVLVAVFVPTVVLGVRVTKEVRGLYQLLNENSAEHGGWNVYSMHFVDRLIGWVGEYVDLSKIDLRGALLRLLEQISRFLLSWGAHFLSNIVSVFVGAVIAFFILFFLFREGESLKLQLTAFLPLRADQFERLFTSISNSIVANVYGCIAVGASQGVLMSLGFWALGLPSPVLWGLVTALCSLLPILGSFVVWGPATMLLVLSGHWGKGLILLFWSAAVVAQVDHLLRTWVISQRANMHPFLMFFALLGGVKAFGPLGLFIGPVVVSITLAALKMLRETNLGFPAA